MAQELAGAKAQADAATLAAQANKQRIEALEKAPKCCQPVPIPVVVAPCHSCSTVTLNASHWRCVRPYGRVGFTAVYSGRTYTWVNTQVMSDGNFRRLTGKIQYVGGVLYFVASNGHRYRAY